MLADFSGKPFRCSENDKVGIAKLHERNLGEARISAVYDIITHFSQNAYDAFSAAQAEATVAVLWKTTTF